MGSLLVIAFCAWAGVVWQTGDRILTLLHAMRGEYQQLSTKHELHRQEPWHSGMQSHVLESEQMMSVTRSRLERLERDHAKFDAHPD